MARIREHEIERSKPEVSLERLVEAGKTTTSRARPLFRARVENALRHPCGESPFIGRLDSRERRLP